MIDGSHQLNSLGDPLLTCYLCAYLREAGFGSLLATTSRPAVLPMRQYYGDIVDMRDTHFFEEDRDICTNDIWVPVAFAVWGAVMLTLAIAFGQGLSFPGEFQMAMLSP
jgi:hypothetical protein